MFSIDMEHVVLIKKERPDWMKGLLNGTGGKLNDGESPKQGMEREFREETGLINNDWKAFAILGGKDFHVTCFKTFSNDYLKARSVTDERIQILKTSHIKPDSREKPKFMHHVPALICCAMDDKLYVVTFVTNY